MQFPTKRTTRIATLAVAAAVGIVPLATSTAANAAGAETVTPSANDNLTDGQHITVDGTGFAANASIALIECSTATPNPDPSLVGQDCDLGTYVPTTAGADGSFSDVPFTLSAGAVGTGGRFCPSKVAGGKCYLIAANTDDQTDAQVAELTFAPIISVTPDTDVKSGDQLTVDGYGFPPSKTAYVTECAIPPGLETCNGGSNIQPPTDANGTFSGAVVTVTTGPWPNTSASCSAGDTCLITATTDLSGQQPDQSTAAPFTFAAEQTVTTVKTAIYAFSKVKHGEVKISGSIAHGTGGISGLKLKLYQREKGTKKWDFVAGKKSGTNGTYAFKHLKHYKHTEQYKVKHSAQQIGNTRYPRSASDVVTVK